MKLRIRSLETKETLKIDIQSPSSSLHDLKISIADKISSSSDTIHLSLNRKDNIDAPPQHSLQSIGIASGDLIFYTQNPNGFVSGEQSQPLIPFPISQQQQQQTLNVNNNIEPERIIHDSDMVDVNNPVDVHLEEADSLPREETLAQEDEMMGFSEESEEDPDVVIEKSSSSSSVPCFLRKVLEEEVGHNNNNNNTEGGDYKLLVIAVHAVFLESGFVGFDTGTHKKIHGFHLQEGWASSESNNVSLRYTVSDLLNSDGGDSVETVVLKFLTYGKFVKVYGSLSRNSVQLHQLCLDKSQFVPSINFLWMNMDEKDDGSLSKSSHESKVFEFWKIAKDKLALPLLIDLCERTGLPSPPCFMRLPFDLKLRILELLPGVDIAQFGCVSSELRYLSSNNKLWRQKLVEEFSFLDVEGIVQDSWKEKYVSCRKNRARQRARVRQIRRPHYPRGGELDLLYRPREPYPIPFPGVIGGDFDRFPAPFGNHPSPSIHFPGVIGGDLVQFPAPFGSHRATRFPSVFRHNCNLGGHNI